jgi:hypothetical protein
VSDYDREASCARSDCDAAGRKVAGLASFAIGEAFIAGSPGLQLALDVVSDQSRPPTSERLLLIARDATERWLTDTLRAIVDALAANKRSQHEGVERLRSRAKTFDNAYERILRYVPPRCPRDAKTVILRDTQTGLFVRATPMRETTRFVEYGVSFVDGGNVRVTKGKAGRHEVWR